MFFPRRVPPALAESKLLGLRASLNTPVLATEELPAGPAEAAIVVLVGRDGTPSVTLATQSVKSGALAFYAFEGPLDGEADLETALDGALSFGESMGFLFDDDALGQGDTASQRVLATWLARLEDAAGAPLGKRPQRPEPAGARRPAAEEESVLELAPQDAGGSPPELVLDRPVDPPSARASAPTAAGPSAPLPLSKFRRALAAPGGEKRASEKPAAGARQTKEKPASELEGERAPADGDSVLLTPHGPAVGRVQLVKQRREEAQQAPLDPLLRLLASL